MLSLRPSHGLSSCPQNFGFERFFEPIAGNLVIRNSFTLEKLGERQLRLSSKEYEVDRLFILPSDQNLIGMDLSPTSERMVLIFDREVYIYDITHDITTHSFDASLYSDGPFRSNNTFIFWNDDHQFILYTKTWNHKRIISFWEMHNFEYQQDPSLIFGRREAAGSYRPWLSEVVWRGSFLGRRLIALSFNLRDIFITSDTRQGWAVEKVPAPHRVRAPSLKVKRTPKNGR